MSTPPEQGYWCRGAKAADVIAAFIDAHPGAELIVATGYVSVAGLAWLADHTSGPVTVIVGDARHRRFKAKHDGDRQAAVERPGSRVFRWYRNPRDGSGEAIAHGKAVICRRDGATVAALVGSANLTNAGLRRHAELMVPAHPASFPQLDHYVHTATQGPQRDATAQVIEMCEDHYDSPAPPYRAPAPRRAGCMSRVAVFVSIAVGLTAAVGWASVGGNTLLLVSLSLLWWAFLLLLVFVGSYRLYRYAADRLEVRRIRGRANR